MQATIRPHTAHLDHPVWEALSHYKIGPDDAQLDFAQRLARENGWSEKHAARVIGEYRRFCFLAVTADEELTPSDAVDQAWHLHLSYSRDYWERFCPEVLRRPLHHGPTPGGEEARGRYFEQYAQTLARYERVFGEEPPADVWPSGAQRLIEDPKARRIHPRDAIIVSRKLARGAFWVAIALAIIIFLTSRGVSPS